MEALIKVDVDSMEIDVLRDALATIHRTRPILCVDNDREAKSDDLLHSIAALGYDLFWHRPPSLQPSERAENSENAFKEIPASSEFWPFPSDPKHAIMRNHPPRTAHA